MDILENNLLIKMYSFGEFYEPEGDMNLIEQGLYLGSMFAARSRENLREHNITHVLALLDSFTHYQKLEGISYLQIAIGDYVGNDIAQHIPDAIRFISEGQREGNVLVHCAAGVSRSASIVISYIMIKNSLEFEDARNFVMTRRSCIWPNEGFVRQLKALNAEEYKKFLN
jgi:protein-tyrosine phosphatase